MSEQTDRKNKKTMLGSAVMSFFYFSNMEHIKGFTSLPH